VTNNCGFYIWWLGLFDVCITITLNYNSSYTFCVLSYSDLVSQSWCRAPSAAHDQIYITIWQLRSCFCGAPFLTRGRVCLLYMLLALASAVFLGSYSLGTCDRSLLSQIWDFPIRCLLLLEGSRWRYSTPPPHGRLTCTSSWMHCLLSAWRTE
jgi:hypothetical protein